MASAKVVLAFDVWHDIKRHKWTYAIMISVVISSFAVIYYTHLNRQATSSLEVMLTERDELDIEWRNLLLEQNSLAEHSAIETKAAKLLNMQRPSVDSEVIIKHP
ncbi:cell division protein FtsL [Thalassotalea sp. PLHSN55]|uniref:cell division protein FtsL n=1 Tax=Thalassotalea sp. PLHSN55 TaxID=3435888 RepID=UPI003F86E0D0